MKHFIIIFILLQLINDLSGQENKKYNYQLNVGSTLTIPFQKNVTLGKYNCDIGFFSSLSLIYNLNDRYSLATGVHYDYDNLKKDFILGAQRDKTNLTLQTLKIPFELKYKLFSSSNLFIVAGGYIGNLLSTKEKGTEYLDFSKFVLDPNDPVLNNKQIVETKINTTYRNGFVLVYGLSLGLEYTIKLNDEIKLVILSRYSYGWSYYTRDKYYCGWGYLTRDKVNIKDLNYILIFGGGIKI